MSGRIAPDSREVAYRHAWQQSLLNATEHHSNAYALTRQAHAERIAHDPVAERLNSRLAELETQVALAYEDAAEDYWTAYQSERAANTAAVA